MSLHRESPVQFQHRGKHTAPSTTGRHPSAPHLGSDPSPATAGVGSVVYLIFISVLSYFATETCLSPLPMSFSIHPFLETRTTVTILLITPQPSATETPPNPSNFRFLAARGPLRWPTPDLLLGNARDGRAPGPRLDAARVDEGRRAVGVVAQRRWGGPGRLRAQAQARGAHAFGRLPPAASPPAQPLRPEPLPRRGDPGAETWTLPPPPRKNSFSPQKRREQRKMTSRENRGTSFFIHFFPTLELPTPPTPRLPYTSRPPGRLWWRLLGCRRHRGAFDRRAAHPAVPWRKRRVVGRGVFGGELQQSER